MNASRSPLSQLAPALACGLLAALLTGCASRGPTQPAPPKPVVTRPPAARTPSVRSVLAKIQGPVEQRLGPMFSRVGVPYPPRRVWLLAFKEEERIELWAQGAAGRPTFVREYPILRTSGYAGPKLREGDFQVPEGVYRVLWLNPASSYHLSMKLDYPNDFDRAMAREDGRSNLGGDIFIHGKNESVGCLAMGDDAIEELFVLAARVGVENTTTIIAPHDLRSKPLPAIENRPPWVGKLYASLVAELRRFSP
jgi:hypothetical protein